MEFSHSDQCSGQTGELVLLWPDDAEPRPHRQTVPLPLGPHRSQDVLIHADAQKSATSRTFSSKFSLGRIKTCRDQIKNKEQIHLRECLWNLWSWSHPCFWIGPASSKSRRTRAAGCTQAPVPWRTQSAAVPGTATSPQGDAAALAPGTGHLGPPPPAFCSQRRRPSLGTGSHSSSWNTEQVRK